MFRRFLLLAILSTIPCGLIAQGIDGASGNNLVLFDAGLTNFRPWKLNDQIGAQGFTSLQTIGISLNAQTLVNRASQFDANYALHIFLSMSVKSASDSLEFSVGGWELMTSIYGYDLIKNKTVDLTLAPGVFWGSLKMKTKDATMSNKLHLYKNPFVAPMFRAELRFNISRISLGARWSYRYDITRDNWKRKGNDLPVLPAYHFRETQFMLYLGWRLTFKDI